MLGPALWRSRWLIAVATVLGALLGSQLGLFQDETYTAEARLVLSASAPFDPIAGNNNGNDAQRFVANQVAVIESQPVLTLATDALPGSLSPAGLGDAVDVATLADSDIIVITAEASTAEQAAARADALAAAYQAFVTQQVQAESAAAEATVPIDPVTQLPDPVGIADIRTQAAVYGDGVSIVEQAAVPSSPSSPQPLRDALIGGLLGFFVGVAFALARRGRRPDDGGAALAEAVGAPVLGEVTAPADRTAAATDAAVPAIALEYALGERSGPVLVSGTGPGSPTSAVVRGLAEASTRRVLVVDAGGEGSGLAGGPQPAVPLTRFTTSGPVAPAVVPLGGADEGGREVRHVDLAVVGPAALDAEGLGKLRSSLSVLAGAYELVLVSAGPLSTDPLAFALLRDVSDVVLVTDEGSRRRKDAAEGVESIAQRLSLAGRRCTGIVAVRRRGWLSARRGGRRTPAAPAPAAGPEQPVSEAETRPAVAAGRSAVKRKA